MQVTTPKSVINRKNRRIKKQTIGRYFLHGFVRMPRAWKMSQIYEYGTKWTNARSWFFFFPFNKFKCRKMRMRATQSYFCRSPRYSMSPPRGALFGGRKKWSTNFLLSRFGIRFCSFSSSFLLSRCCWSLPSRILFLCMSHIALVCRGSWHFMNEETYENKKMKLRPNVSLSDRHWQCVWKRWKQMKKK